MNGRVYDYNLGRFMSVDPFIQSTGNSQSINPYSYIMNNPLAGTDPTGYVGCAASRIKSVCEDVAYDKLTYKEKGDQQNKQSTAISSIAYNGNTGKSSNSDSMDIEGELEKANKSENSSDSEQSPQYISSQEGFAASLFASNTVCSGDCFNARAARDVKRQFNEDIEREDVQLAIDEGVGKLALMRRAHGHNDYSDIRIGVGIYENENGQIIVGSVNSDVPKGMDFGLKTKKWGIFGEFVETQSNIRNNPKGLRPVITITTKLNAHTLADMTRIPVINWYHDTSRRTGASNIIVGFNRRNENQFRAVSHGYGVLD